MIFYLQNSKERCIDYDTSNASLIELYPPEKILVDYKQTIKNKEKAKNVGQKFAGINYFL